MILAIGIDAVNLSSTLGVVLVTFMIIEALKAMITNQRFWWGRLPTWLYAIVISAVLSTLANRVFRRDDGTPFLVGNYWEVVGRSILLAASASGLFSWFKNFDVTVAESKPLPEARKDAKADSSSPDL